MVIYSEETVSLGPYGIVRVDHRLGREKSRPTSYAQVVLIIEADKTNGSDEPPQAEAKLLPLGEMLKDRPVPLSYRVPAQVDLDNNSVAIPRQTTFVSTGEVRTFTPVNARGHYLNGR